MSFHEGRTVQIKSENDPTGRLICLPDTLFQISEDKWLSNMVMPNTPLRRMGLPDSMLEYNKDKDTIPVLFGSSDLDDPIVSVGQREITTCIDIFGSMFFLLARVEESVCRDRDEHGRFQASHSMIYREGLLERPLVNEYLEFLYHLLLILVPDLRRKSRRTCIHLSHDVDRPWVVNRRPILWVLRNLVADVAIRRDPGLAGRRIRALVARGEGRHQADPANTFAQLMGASEAIGVKSAFYFITGSLNSGMDANYTLDDPEIRNLLKCIHLNGHEVGIHGSYNSYLNLDQFKKELSTLKRACEELGIEQEYWGGRQHYLRVSVPDTWQIWEESGMTYDSSMGFSDKPGFRCGVCYEFSVFNLKARKKLKLKERPLMVMDTTLLKPNDSSNLEAAVLRIYNQCARYQGEFTLLWHNNNLASAVERQSHQRVIDLLSNISERCI